MILKSYSKINLSLKVTSRPTNGLHEIQSFYCLINLFDEIKIKKIIGQKDKIYFKGAFKKFIKNKDNSIIILLETLRKLKLINSHYSIKVIKKIPVFSGLGGGTSNAAFLMKFLLKNRINENLINRLEKKVGSDIRLFFKKQGFLKNLRSIIEFKKKERLFFVLIQPRIRCSTKEIYSNVRKFSRKEQFNKYKLKSKKEFFNYLSSNRNDLQFIVEKKYPIIKKLLKNIKNEKGCYFSRMTGSGSVCYGLFKDQITAKKALNKLKKRYPRFWFSLSNTV